MLCWREHGVMPGRRHERTVWKHDNTSHCLTAANIASSRLSFKRSREEAFVSFMCRLCQVVCRPKPSPRSRFAAINSCYFFIENLAEFFLQTESCLCILRRGIQMQNLLRNTRQTGMVEKKNCKKKNEKRESTEKIGMQRV